MTELIKEDSHPYKPPHLSKELPVRILIAEDNLINQKLLVRILEVLGYKADAVSDGKEVLLAVQKKTYELILMDIKMPEMNGDDAARELRRMYGVKVPFIIAVTAFALKEDRDKYISEGMDGLIAKPFRIEELVEEMRRVLKPTLPLK